MTSTDLLYAFGSDPELFGRILAVHALSDLFATLAEPLFATLTLGVTHDDVSSGRAASIARGVAVTLTAEGAVLAGGHSVVAKDTFASLSVVGQTTQTPPSAEVHVNDVIILSKPLGSGLALSAERLGVAGAPELGEVYDTMASSNRIAADSLSRVQQTETSEVSPIRKITDVSGFGFLHAVRQVAGNSRVKIVADAVPLGPGVADFVEAQAWSGLLDANLMESSGFTAYQPGVNGGLLQFALNDPQTSGGLLAVVSPASAGVQDLVDGGVFWIVGSVEESACALGIEIVPGRIGATGGPE